MIELEDECDEVANEGADESVDTVVRKVNFDETGNVNENETSANMNVATPCAENDHVINNDHKKDGECCEEEEIDIDNNEITSFQQQALYQKVKLSKSKSKIKEEVNADNEEEYKQQLMLKEQREEKSQRKKSSTRVTKAIEQSIRT